MARKPRIHYPGALYHVMVRGNNGENVLSEEVRKIKYLDIIAQYKRKLGFKLYAYCIMDNHAHLLAEVSDTPLSKIMQGIQQVYTQWYNRKNKRTGHVFQQRYKALLCDRENYLLELLRYIHNNPVRANLSEGINYKWSSHIYYIGKEKGNIIDSDKILSMFSSSNKMALKQYLYFMELEDIEIEYEDPGKFHAVKELEEKEDKIQNNKVNIEEIIKKICINEGVTIDDITKRTRKQKISDIRKAIVLIGHKYSDISNKFLAQRLNLSASMISKIKSMDYKNAIDVNEIIRRWEME